MIPVDSIFKPQAARLGALHRRLHQTTDSPRRAPLRGKPPVAPPTVLLPSISPAALASRGQEFSEQLDLAESAGGA